MGCTSSAPQWIVHKSISVGQDGLPLPPDPVSTIANPGADLARTASRDCKPNTVVTLEFECLDDSTDGMATLAGFGLSNSEYDPTIPMSRAREWSKSISHVTLWTFASGTFYSNSAISRGGNETNLYAYKNELPKLDGPAGLVVVQLRTTPAGVVQVKLGPADWINWPKILRPGPYHVVISQTQNHRLKAYSVSTDGVEAQTGVEPGTVQLGLV